MSAETLAERNDRRRAETTAFYERQAEESRQRHAAIIERALDEYDCVGGMPWSEVALIAVDALKADGVVFARFGLGEAESPQPARTENRGA